MQESIATEGKAERGRGVREFHTTSPTEDPIPSTTNKLTLI